MASEFSLDVFEIFVNEFAANALAELSSEAEQSINVSVSHIESHRIVLAMELMLPSNSSDADPATGEIRVVFRESNGGGSFCAQAILKNLAVGTGYSGFSARGKIQHRKIRVTARTNRYNVWEWDEEFRC